MRHEWAGHYLDGRSPERQGATVVVTAGGLEIRTAGGATLRWPAGELRQTQGRYDGQPVRLERDGEAVVVPDPAFLTALREIAAARRLHDPARRRVRAALTALAAGGSLALAAALYQWGIPATAAVAARVVPVSWEERVGGQLFERLFPPASRCGDAEVQAGLDAILQRLTGPLGPVPYRLSVTVVRTPDVNAAAFPGGRIVVLQGLLALSESPEMLAGTLAHEVQHVVRRHATREILESASVGVLLSVLIGDPTGGAAMGLAGVQRMGQLQYRRSHEVEADREGMRLLLAARIDPAGEIAMLERMAGERGPAPPGLLRYLATHPTDAERLAEARALARAATVSPVPLVPDANWADVRRRCDG